MYSGGKSSKLCPIANKSVGYFSTCIISGAIQAYNSNAALLEMSGDRKRKPTTPSWKFGRKDDVLGGWF